MNLERLLKYIENHKNFEYSTKPDYHHIHIQNLVKNNLELLRINGKPFIKGKVLAAEKDVSFDRSVVDIIIVTTSPDFVYLGEIKSNSKRATKAKTS